MQAAAPRVGLATGKEDQMEKAFVGTKLRQLRRARGQTQSDMADLLGISAAYVNMLEKNQRSLSVNVLMALSTSMASTGVTLSPTTANPPSPICAQRSRTPSSVASSQIWTNFELQQGMRRFWWNSFSGSTKAIRQRWNG